MQERAGKDQHHHPEHQQSQIAHRCQQRTWKGETRQPEDHPCKVRQGKYPEQRRRKRQDACIEWEHTRGHGQYHGNQKSEQPQGIGSLISPRWNQATVGECGQTIEKIDDACQRKPQKEREQWNALLPQDFSSLACANGIAQASAKSSAERRLPGCRSGPTRCPRGTIRSRRGVVDSESAESGWRVVPLKSMAAVLARPEVFLAGAAKRREQPLPQTTPPTRCDINHSKCS
jgi:hypothetical protein